MEVAIKAAKEVNADVLAPELYRSAQESSLLARREYRYKNFLLQKNTPIRLETTQSVQNLNR